MNKRYPWITTRVIRKLPPARPSQRTVTECGNCGEEWVGTRKSCPACLVRVDEADGG